MKDYKLIIPHHSQEVITAFIDARNKVFFDAGLSIPNPGIFCLPGEVPVNRVGPFILHDSVDWPGSDWGDFGVEIKTGATRLVKEFGVRNQSDWAQNMWEVQFSLYFAVIARIQCERSIV